MGKVRKSFVSFATRLLNMPPPPAPIEEARPSDDTTALAILPATSGPSGVDKVSHETLVDPDSQDKDKNVA